MKLCVLLIFAGCAVNCDDSGNYYVIERPSDEPVRGLKPFQVYWNVPTFQCKSKKIVFEQLYEKYGIIHNQNDTFAGDQITIMYDPGLFPAILKEESTGKLRIRNGGVPQEGNLDEHMTAFRYVLDQSIPDPQFSGIGIIDFESWRPTYRQNWGVLAPYKNLSVLIERRLHPWWTKNMIEREAKSRFERAGREFMQATLALARLLRPLAKWGYYGFPYCYNMAINKPVETCSSDIQKENDQISWLWTESTALFPSVYSSKNLSSAQLGALIRGRVAESARVTRGGPILPYFWYKYRDAGFMNEVDLRTAIKTMYKSQASGFIIWGASDDVNTVARCEKLKLYLEQVLGPEIAKYTKQSYKIVESHDNSNDSSYNNITTQNPLDLLTGDSNENIQTVDLSSEEMNTRSSEHIESKLDDEIMHSTDQNTDEKNILIDIILSLIENVQKIDTNEAVESTMAKILKDRKKGTPIHDTFIKINDNDSDFTTKSPFDRFKKKAAHLSMFYPTKKTAILNEMTYDTKETTTDYDLLSTTAELLYDSNNATTHYNQNKLNVASNYTLSEEDILNAEITSNDGDETTVPIVFDTELKYYSTFTEPTTEITVDDMYENQNTTETSYTSYTSTKESTPQIDVTESSTDGVSSTTDRTTTIDDVYDDSEYQVLITLE